MTAAAEVIAPTQLLELEITVGGETQTLREYLIGVLIQVWESGGQLSLESVLSAEDGQVPVYEAMFQAGLIEKFADGGVNCYEWSKGDQLIAEALRALR